MPRQSFQETRNDLVNHLTTVYHRLQDQQPPPATVGEYLLEFIGEIDILKQITHKEVDLSNKRAYNCCIHRLNRVQAQLREQAVLLQGYPQGESYQICPAIFSIAIEMIAVQIGRCIINSHPDRDAAQMELKANFISANLLCNSLGVCEMEIQTLKDLWRTLNAGVPGCRCHQCLRRRVQV